MKSLKVSDDVHRKLKETASEAGLTLDAVVRKFIGEDKSSLGKPELIRKGMAGRAYICPHCGSQVFMIQEDDDCYLICLCCDWAGFLGKYHFPESIDDLREKLT